MLLTQATKEINIIKPVRQRFFVVFIQAAIALSGSFQWVQYVNTPGNIYQNIKELVPCRKLFRYIHTVLQCLYRSHHMDQSDVSCRIYDCHFPCIMVDGDG